MKIYILLGHPDKDSFNGSIADRYASAARSGGHDVRMQKIGEMKFDPVLWKGYKTIQALEPDLEQAKENILWCERWVIIYPVWWGSVPAILKGFLDRTLYPGFAFKYHVKGVFWDKLLKGRSAQLITTSDAPWWWLWLSYRNSDANAMTRATLKFCGISPVKLYRIDRVKYLREEERERAIRRVLRWCV